MKWLDCGRLSVLESYCLKVEYLSFHLFAFSYSSHFVICAILFLLHFLVNNVVLLDLSRKIVMPPITIDHILACHIREKDTLVLSPLTAGLGTRQLQYCPHQINSLHTFSRLTRTTNKWVGKLDLELKLGFIFFLRKWKWFVLLQVNGDYSFLRKWSLQNGDYNTIWLL